jgi:cation transport regulator ChaC
MSERYFAYGSNLWVAQMVARTGPIPQGADRPRIARLPNYRLTFNMHGDDGQVFANVIYPGQGVLGVIYCCTVEALLKMDQYEKGYERRQVQVVLENGAELTAVTYIAGTAQAGNVSQPTADYLQKILCGARQHGLPEAYIKEIEAVALVEGEG